MNNGMEADIVIFDINTIIEYNGIYWHRDSNRDARKKEYIESNGIRLITILDMTASRRADASVKIIDNDTIYFCRYQREMSPLMKVLSELLGVKLIEQENQELDVVNMVYESYGNQNLLYQYPSIAQELLDGDASKIFISDSLTRRWKCKKCGTIFKTSVGHRVFDGTDCPACAGNIAIPNVNDIKTLYPEYAYEIIDRTDSDKLNILPFSSLYVTWKCSSCNHVWRGQINKRIVTKTGCPVCGYIPITIDRHNFVDINYICSVVKPIDKVLLNGSIIETDLSGAIGILLVFLHKKGNTANNILNKLMLHDKINEYNFFKKPKYICTIDNKDMYIEGRYGTEHKVSILYTLVTGFNIDVKFKVKDENKLPNRITLNKNGIDYNVTTRLNGKIIYIGKRNSIKDAVKLKLSAEYYIFGHILIPTDMEYLDNENIPDFTKCKEYFKLVDKNIIT